MRGTMMRTVVMVVVTEKTKMKGHRRHTLHSWQRIACMLRNAGMTDTRTCMAALATGQVAVAAGGAVAVVMAMGEVKGHRRHTLHSWQRIACMLRNAGMTGTRTCMAALATGQVAVAAGGAVAV